MSSISSDARVVIINSKATKRNFFIFGILTLNLFSYILKVSKSIVMANVNMNERTYTEKRVFSKFIIAKAIINGEIMREYKILSFNSSCTILYLTWLRLILLDCCLLRQK